MSLDVKCSFFLYYIRFVGIVSTMTAINALCSTNILYSKTDLTWTF